MFGKKKNRSERSFSIMLAEELLRAELKKLYGDEIKIFRCDIEATPPAESTYKVGDDSANISDEEWKVWHLILKHRDAGENMRNPMLARTVNFAAVIGPLCERCVPSNPSGDRRRQLGLVKAVCRLFSIETGCVWWRPHFLKFVVTDGLLNCYNGVEVCYEYGLMDGKERLKDRENPCQDMCDMQTSANYPVLRCPK